MNAPVTPPAIAEARYFNRELSWLAFNRRVMEEARNVAHPLLERLRFLSISGNNLDEFFMVRVAGIKAHQLQGIEEPSQDGLTPTQQLDAIAAATQTLVVEQQAEWHHLSVELARRGIEVVHDVAGAAPWRSVLEQHFVEQIFPILTPQALDPAHPFPFIPNKGLAVVFDLV
ncbi:MAG: RNA degradosome polyphosphate kinase, partial [Sphingopyxis sp.]|nr:RNA degradosome polyphosphate kinase [Sphingopyxis sp.]